MNDTLANAPLGQYADQLLALDCIPAVDLGKQGHSDTGNGGVEEYGKVSRRELGVDWHRGNPSLRTRQLPAERTEAVGRVNGGKAAQVVRLLREAVFAQEHSIRHEYAATDAYAPHLKVAVGIQALPNPDRDVDALADQIHRAVGDHELDAEKRISVEEPRQRFRESALDADWAADANEALRLRFHSQRDLVDRLRLVDGSSGMTVNVSPYLGYAQSTRRTLKQPQPELLFQDRYSSADSRFRNSQSARRGGEALMFDDRYKKMEVVEIPHAVRSPDRTVCPDSSG